MGGFYKSYGELLEEQQERNMEENKNESIVKSAIVGVAPKLLRLGLVVAGLAFLISRVPRN